MSSKLNCTRCGSDFTEDTNSDTACQYHPGVPEFHDALKSWTCCKDKNKPVLEFDQFMKIEGCAWTRHTTEKQKAVMPKQQDHSKAGVTVSAPSKTAGDGKELYGEKKKTEKAAEKMVVDEPVAEPEGPVFVPGSEKPSGAVGDDPEGYAPKEGDECQRKGCNKTYNAATKRHAKECMFHTGDPIFHDASKGWSCCSKRVLEFDQMFAIEGCQYGRHRFQKVEASETATAASSAASVECRHDWYQSETAVTMTVFAKKVDKEKSNVEIGQQKVKVDLVFQDGCTFERVYLLADKVVGSQSKFTILSTKVEIKLVKAEAGKWTKLLSNE